MSTWLILLFIYLGTLFYSLAAYLHLSIYHNWTFMKAFLIAIPLVILEYQFSLRGNRYANTELKLNAVQILIITIAFYFINVWIINHFILKNSVVWWRECLAFLFIICAFATLAYKPSI